MLPTEGRQRPVGLICLSGVAVLLSLVLVYAGVGLFFQIGPLLNHGRYKPDYYPLGHIVLILSGICLLVAAWIAAATAMDLWRFRKRGRSLAIVGALILAIFTVAIAFGSQKSGLELAVSALILIFTIEVVVYLCLPSVRSRFESQL